MAFSEQSLPASVQSAFREAKSLPVLWPGVIQTAVAANVRDENLLTNIVFFLHHPERNGRAIGSAETSLVEQWKGFRTLVRLMVPNLITPASGAGSSSSPSDPVKERWLKYLEGKQLSRNWFTEKALAWAMTPPVGREAMITAGADPNWGRLVMWKEQQHNPGGCNLCSIYEEQSFQWFQEFPTSQDFYTAKTGDARVARVLSLTYDSWNTSVAFYMVEKLRCRRWALVLARADGVALLEATVGGLTAVMGLTGARSLFASGTVAPMTPQQAAAKLMEPGFVGRVDAFARTLKDKRLQECQKKGECI